MKLEKHLPDFTILTALRVDELSKHDDYEEYAETMTEEQRSKLESLGYDYNKNLYLIHFFDSAYSDDEVCITEICDAVEMCAIKDGYDLVMFENGHPGYVAYYNGCANGFEIIGTPDDLRGLYEEKVDIGDIELYDLYDLGFNFDCYLEYEDNIRKLIEEI